MEIETNGEGRPEVEAASEMNDGLGGLMPCPFCGETRVSIEHITEEENPDFGGSYVTCENKRCMASSALVFECGDDPIVILRERWNRRVGLSNWSPIDTAPKNRKIIGGYRNENGKWRTVMACFYEKGTLEISGEDEETDDEWAPEGWYEETETAEYMRQLPSLTHWMPLPTAPMAV